MGVGEKPLREEAVSNLGGVSDVRELKARPGEYIDDKAQQADVGNGLNSGDNRSVGSEYNTPSPPPAQITKRMYPI